MKKDYDLDKLKKRIEKPQSSPSATKVSVNIRLDGSTVAAIRTEAERMGIPYQTLIGSILHRFANGELIDKSSVAS